jgi:hypothetical protein
MQSNVGNQLINVPSIQLKGTWNSPSLAKKGFTEQAKHRDMQKSQRKGRYGVMKYKRMFQKLQTFLKGWKMEGKLTRS